MPLGQLGMLAVNAATGGIMGLANNGMQLQQQRKLQELSIEGQKQLTDYNMAKQLELWKATSYEAQREQMEKAGLNPALMYGMSGGGGQTANLSTGNVGMAQADPRAINGGMEIAMQQRAQTELLKAQKENIEADTANKKAEEGFTKGAKTASTEADTKLKGTQRTLAEQQSWETGIRAAMLQALNTTRPDGSDVNDTGENKFWESIGYRERIADMKSKELDSIVKDKQVQEIIEKIQLMKKQGTNIDEITNNLKKEGLIKDFEIKMNQLNLSPGDVGGFIKMLIHKL